MGVTESNHRNTKMIYKDNPEWREIRSEPVNEVVLVKRMEKLGKQNQLCNRFLEMDEIKWKNTILLNILK